ncbi:zinc finger, CCHC-type containing protein [Tanacetum coccineum]
MFLLDKPDFYCQQTAPWTDAGVHALGQVAHFLTPFNYDYNRLEDMHAALNGLLSSELGPIFAVEVALLLQIGREAIPPDIVPKILATCDRKELAKVALVAPPHGLCLAQVKYNAEISILPGLGLQLVLVGISIATMLPEFCLEQFTADLKICTTNLLGLLKKTWNLWSIVEKGCLCHHPHRLMVEKGHRNKGFGYYNNGMFMLNLNKGLDDSGSVYMSSSTVVNSSLWHARLEHVHYKRMLEMSKDDLIHVIDENPEKCTTCMLTKFTRQPFKSITRKSVILELIHSDLCDFRATPSLGNKKYVITFIDDASRFCYVYLLHAKDEALDKFRISKTEVELQQNDLIKTLRTDRGGEYYDSVFF